MGIFDVELDVKHFELIEAGRYLGYISEVVEKTSKAGNKYIQIEFTLNNERKVWDNLHWHTDQCIKISAGKLESLGFTRDERKSLDVTALVSAINFKKDGQRYDVNVGIRKSPEFGDQNTVKSFKVVDKLPF